MANTRSAKKAARQTARRRLTLTKVSKRRIILSCVVAVAAMLALIKRPGREVSAILRPAAQ